MNVAVTESSHVIDGPAGPIQARLLRPETTVRGVAVMCHPHPLHGGTMDNKVVYTVQRALSASGFACLRFNFRGVGQSAGEFDHGLGESEDLASVTAWLRATVSGQMPLYLAGFSFGSFVAARMANRLSAQQLISIAPPVQRFDFSTFEPPRCPWLVVMGDADEVVDPVAVFDWLETLNPAPDVRRFQGAGHFFHGRLVELRETVEQYLQHRT